MQTAHIVLYHNKCTATLHGNATLLNCPESTHMDKHSVHFAVFFSHTYEHVGLNRITDGRTDIQSDKMGTLFAQIGWLSTEIRIWFLKFSWYRFSYKGFGSKDECTWPDIIVNMGNGLDIPTRSFVLNLHRRTSHASMDWFSRKMIWLVSFLGRWRF